MDDNYQREYEKLASQLMDLIIDKVKQEDEPHAFHLLMHFSKLCAEIVLSTTMSIANPFKEKQAVEDMLRITKELVMATISECVRKPNETLQ